MSLNIYHCKDLLLHNIELGPYTFPHNHPVYLFTFTPVDQSTCMSVNIVLQAGDSLRHGAVHLRGGGRQGGADPGTALPTGSG